jgi:hypothetical protein
MAKFRPLPLKIKRVSKIKKNKKNFEKVWSSIINKGSYEMRFLRQHVNND